MSGGERVVDQRMMCAVTAVIGEHTLFRDARAAVHDDRAGEIDRGGRLLTDRRIFVEAERRPEIDVHHLARALLRLAQEQYDARPTVLIMSTPTIAASPLVPPHEAHTGPNGPPRGAARAARDVATRGHVRDADE